jgi:hypothetical protein
MPSLISRRIATSPHPVNSLANPYLRSPRRVSARAPSQHPSACCDHGLPQYHQRSLSTMLEEAGVVDAQAGSRYVRIITRGHYSPSPLLPKSVSRRAHLVGSAKCRRIIKNKAAFHRLPRISRRNRLSCAVVPRVLSHRPEATISLPEVMLQELQALSIHSTGLWKNSPRVLDQTRSSTRRH